MRLQHGLMVILGLTTSTWCPANASAPSQLERFDKAIASAAMDEAADAYQLLMLERLPTRGGPIMDSTLDALAGRLSLERGDPMLAVQFLNNDARGDESDHPARMIALGDALLALGQTLEAEAAFSSVGPSATTDQQALAMLGRAAAIVARDPRQALAIVAPLATFDNRHGWRAFFITSQAEGILGNVAAARSAADKASQAATSAMLIDYAPLVSLHLQAAVAAQEKQPERVAAMLAAVPSVPERTYKFGRRFASLAPQCGLEGIRESDSVIVAIVPETRAPIARPVILAATRPEIAAIFERALAGTFVTERDVSLATGPIGVVRCRFSPSPPSEGIGTDFSFASFLTRSHVRPLFLQQSSYRQPDELTDAAVRLERFELKAGRDSPVVAAGLMELSGMTIASDPARPETQKTAALLIDRSSDAFAKLPASMQFPYRRARLSDNLAAMSNAQKASWFADALSAQSFDDAYRNLADIIANDAVPADARLTMIDAVLPRYQKSKNKDRYEALVYARLSALRTAHPGEVTKYLKDYALDQEICDYRSTSPRMIANDFSDNLFPRDGIIAGLVGISALETDIDKDGKPKNTRVIVQSPPLVFDTVLNGAQSTMRFEAPQDSKGRSAACRAKRQVVRWQLPRVSEAGPEMSKMTEGFGI